jgi:hypothetical protein
MADFDPDAYLAKKAFDPDEYLRKTPAPPPVGHYAKPRQPVAEGPASSGDPTYDLFVSPEAQNAPGTVGERAAKLPQYYGEMLPMAADSATYGLGNRGVAWGRSVLEGQRGGTYADRLAEQNAYLNQLREADPDRAVMAELLGGVAGGAGLAKAGITLAKPGVGWISRAVRGGTEGALQGAAQGAGGSYGTLEDKLIAAGKGGAMGGVLGTGVPLAVTGASGVKTLADIYKGNIPQYPPAFLRAVDADLLPGGRRVGVQNVGSLGDEGALVDTGPSMLRLAAAAKATPGEGSSKLENMLVAREDMTTPRVREGTKQALGPDFVPSHVERDVELALKQIGPEWDAALNNGKAVDTQKLANWLDTQIINLKGDAVPALEKVRRDLNIKGTDVLDPHPRSLHETRKAIDGILYKSEGVGAKPDKNVATALTNARRQITEELHDKVPGMANLDAKTAELKSRMEAYQRGQDLFDTDKKKFVRPVEWQEEKAAMAVPKGGPRAEVPGPSLAPTYSEMGTRSEVERMVLTGLDDLNVLRRIFGPHKSATEILKEQFGIDSVAQFRHLLDTNQTFRDSYRRVVQGSKTADTLEGIADSERGYFALPKFSPSGAVNFVGDTLERAQQGFGAGTRNRIAELMALQGQSLKTELPDILKASKEQAYNDISRALVESTIRRGGTAAMPERGPLKITVTPNR